jgi:hypothetical protein
MSRSTCSAPPPTPGFSGRKSIASKGRLLRAEVRLLAKLQKWADFEPSRAALWAVGGGGIGLLSQVRLYKPCSSNEA